MLFIIHVFGLKFGKTKFLGLGCQSCQKVYAKVWALSAPAEVARFGRKGTLQDDSVPIWKIYKLKMCFKLSSEIRQNPDPDHRIFR